MKKRLNELKGPGEILAEIRMSRRGFRGSFLIVEGDDDSRLWRSRVARRSCELVIGGGKKAVLGGICLVDGNGVEGVLGIIDADFDIVEGHEVPSQNLVRTDAHDVETMILASVALDRVLAELSDPVLVGSFEARSGISVRAALLERGLPFGKLRWLSERNALGIPFDKISPFRFVDESTWSLDECGLLTHVEGLVPGLSAGMLRKGMDSLPPVDPWQICQGHDLVAILSIGLKKVLGRSNPGPEGVCSRLRCAFELEATNMYRMIQSWESRSTPFIILETSRR